MADATRFRSEMGLATEPGVVADITGSRQRSEEFGLALTQAEEALLNERAKLPAELDRLAGYQRKRASKWGGLWITYPTGGTLDNVATVNVSLVDNPSGHEAALRGLIPENTTLELRQVRHSEETLDALHEVIADDRDYFRALGTVFYSAVTLVPENIVEISVSRLDPDIEAKLLARFGADKVRIREGNEVKPDVCTRTNCGPPWRGGMKIYRTATAGCTSNFVARYYSGVWFYNLWTSGHCGNGTWREGSGSGTIIGSTVSNYFFNNSDADVQTISMPASARDNKFINSTSANCADPCPLTSIVSKEGRDADEIGEMVCNNGAFSGRRCGTLKATAFSFNWEEEGLVLLRQRRATYSRQPGDSGGPVVTATTNRAAGSHTHFEILSGTTYAVYSHVFEMEQITGQTIYLGGS